MEELEGGELGLAEVEDVEFVAVDEHGLELSEVAVVKADYLDEVLAEVYVLQGGEVEVSEVDGGYLVATDIQIEQTVLGQEPQLLQPIITHLQLANMRQQTPNLPILKERLIDILPLHHPPLLISQCLHLHDIVSLSFEFVCAFVVQNQYF